MLNGFTRNIAPFTTVPDEKLDDIERGVFYILEKVGLKFEVETVKPLKIFERGGAVVDFDSKIVRFPPGLVEESINNCPGSFRVEARDPKNDLMIGGNSVYFSPGPGLQHLDLNTFEPRLPTREEFYDAVTVYDALPNLHILHNNSPYTSMVGVSEIMSTIESYAARARNSTKAQYHAQLQDNDVFCLEIAKAVGAKGIFGVGAVSPLCWSDDAVNCTIRGIEAGVPFIPVGGSLWGATAPATIAGELVTNIAESVGPLVLAQLIDPGHPVLPGSFTFPMNMKRGEPLFGNISIALATAALVQFWKRYDLPSFIIEAAISNSKCMDFQSGYEKGMLALAQAMAGASVLWVHGTVYGELTAHPVQAIMDDEIAGSIGHILGGIEINDETLALDLIEEVGHLGMYLDKAHTRKWWRKSQYSNDVADDSNLYDWLQSGKRTIVEYAKDKMEEILNTHKVSVPLSDKQEEDIQNILMEARRFYKDKIEN
jgi:trimethylamine--corrinoid protein Co-methyltransferase